MAVITCRRYQNELDSSNSNGNRLSNTSIYGSGRR
nr:MAG TPA: hypothetical protein [Caudoviricetes sp.]